MALNPIALGDQIASLLISPDAPPQAQAQIKAMWEQIAGVIVAHIIANGVVTVPPGVAVTTTGGAGATTAPGIGVIT